MTAAQYRKKYTDLSPDEEYILSQHEGLSKKDKWYGTSHIIPTLDHYRKVDQFIKENPDYTKDQWKAFREQPHNASFAGSAYPVHREYVESSPERFLEFGSKKTKDIRGAWTIPNMAANLKRLEGKKQYGEGGWLKENAGTVGGAALGLVGSALLGPVGGMVGMQLGQGLGNQIAGNGAEELADDYMIPTSLPRQHYQRAKAGMNLTQYAGPRHEQGGVALGGLPVEVEGGETRTNNMIHSDRIKVTKGLVSLYPKVLKKSDVGKTMAEVTKQRAKKFERRKNDELSDKAFEITMLPLEQLSEELSQIIQPETEQAMANGGDITAQSARQILGNGLLRGKRISSPQLRYRGSNGKVQAAGGLELAALSKAQEFAPMIFSGLDTVGALISGPETVDYGQVGYAPTKVSYASAEPGIKNIRRTFANAESKLRKYNPIAIFLVCQVCPPRKPVP
ncbi:MAG: hypothetical protein HC875_29565 [Anaerolineales bacterium]|nr:hypothetical protein [Anaerolineales bacterium]